MTTTETRTGYFVIFAYLGVKDAKARETTVYLTPGQTLNDVPAIIARGRDLPEHRVVLFAIDTLDGLTRERADEMRSAGKAWDAARAECGH